MTWETASGIFPGSVCCWERFFPSRELWRTTTSSIGHRTPHDAPECSQVFYEAGSHSTILLGIEDITEKRNLENEKDDLIRQKQMLLEELEHRVVNSLQIIASIIMLKAGAVESEETRRHLEDAHNRVISVATVQKHLHGSVANAMIEMRPCLETLCAALAQSMISDNRPISIQFDGKGGTSSRRNAASIGLIVTELVINSLKHAFKDTSKDGAIRVSYDVSGTDWQLAVSDNGSGNLTACSLSPRPDLVRALSKHWQSSSKRKW